MNAPAATASAVIPFRPVDDAGLPTDSQWWLAAVLCLGVLALLLWMLRRRAAGTGLRRREGLIEVLEARRVGVQTDLVVVRYAGRRLLLSVGSGGAVCLRDDAEGEGTH